MGLVVVGKQVAAFCRGCEAMGLGLSGTQLHRIFRSAAAGPASVPTAASGELPVAASCAPRRRQRCSWLRRRSRGATLLRGLCALAVKMRA